jgi:hypothetical protein
MKSPNVNTPDQSGVAKAETSTFDACESYSQGFAKGTFFKGKGIRQTVQPFGRVQVIASQGS